VLPRGLQSNACLAEKVQEACCNPRSVPAGLEAAALDATTDVCRWRTIWGDALFRSLEPLKNLCCADGEHAALTLRKLRRGREVGPACLHGRVAALICPSACTDMVDVILRRSYAAPTALALL